MNGRDVEGNFRKSCRIKIEDLSPDVFFIKILISFLINVLQLKTRVLVKVIILAKLIGAEYLVDRATAITTERLFIEPERLFAWLTAMKTLQILFYLDFRYHDILISFETVMLLLCSMSIRGIEHD